MGYLVLNQLVPACKEAVYTCPLPYISTDYRAQIFFLDIHSTWPVEFSSLGPNFGERWCDKGILNLTDRGIAARNYSYERALCVKWPFTSNAVTLRQTSKVESKLL